MIAHFLSRWRERARVRVVLNSPLILTFSPQGEKEWIVV